MNAQEIAATFERTQRMALLRDLRALRLEARDLARSGHPGARAEGKRAVKMITNDIDSLEQDYKTMSRDAERYSITNQGVVSW